MDDFKDAVDNISNSNEAIDKPWRSWSYDDWAKWLDEKLNERGNVFLSDPDELIGSFNRERSRTRDYHGHELVELIQNADDSGINYSKPNKLLIKLTDFGLFLANTGVPFSPEGIKSLIVSDNSPKQFLRTKCIGYKGLGFRSILGWTSSIVILSGNLSIGFNEKLAINWLNKLRQKSDKVDEKVRKFKDSGLPDPIAILSIPYLISVENTKSNEDINLIYDEGKRILEKGYDTVVCLLFKDAKKTLGPIQKQINLLKSEIMLFLQFLEKLEIQSPERNECWSVERKETEIIVNSSGGTPDTWKLFKREGTIPGERLRPEQVQHDKYEIKLAIPGKVIDINRLFVFFPTEVLFPFPIIVHATFEVGDDRQHLIDSDVNRFMAEELAELMVESAEKIKDGNDPWHALATISPRGDIDPMLNKFEFLEILRNKIKDKPLLPVRNKNFETAEKSKRINGNFDSLLTGNSFDNLCIYTEDRFINNQLNLLKIDYIVYEALREGLNSLTDNLPLEKRANLVYLLVQNNLIQDIEPELLIDTNGQRIHSDRTIFLPPEGKVFSLPVWVTQKILNASLISILRNKFQVSRTRDLIINLRAFNIQEYNLNSIVSSILAAANRKAKDAPGEELQVRQQMICALWGLYSSDNEKVKLREDLTVLLPTRQGEFRSAKNIYFGEEYKYGRILEYLYINIDANLFVADPAMLGFDKTPAGLEDFLCWLGVNTTPRCIEMDSSPSEFMDFVISSLQYPAHFSELTVETQAELRHYNCSKLVSKLLQVDELNKLLSFADPIAIICWIATNQDIESWRTEGDKKADFYIQRSPQRIARKLVGQSIPSFPFWLLKTSRWLPTGDGTRQAPCKCSFARGASDLSPIIGVPAINIEHPLIKELNLDTPAIKRALMNIGVVDDLDNLPWDLFYELLLELPDLNPEGEKAKRLYRTLIGRNESDLPIGKKYKEFLANGKMLGKIGEAVSYYPVHELYYLDNITLPRNIAEQYPLLELDKRKGASKVKKFFGVEQLTEAKIQPEISGHQEHPCSSQFQSEIERLKLYIYALRVDEDTKRTDLRALKNFNIILCKSVDVLISVGNEKKQIELKEGDAINIGSKAYLVAEPSDYNRNFLEDELLSDAVGEIISNILKVDVKNEIARLATCSINKRDLLLNRLVGGSGIERMNKTKDVFQIPLEQEEDFKKPLPLDSSPPVIEPKPEKTAVENGQITDKTDDVGAVTVAGGMMPPIQGKRVIIRKLQNNPQTSSRLHSRKPTNPDRAENLAIRMEEAQNRYPLKISFIRGAESYGCDILSFNSKNDLDAFKVKNNSGLVARFIEVKGTTTEKGTICLKGYELNCASNFRERYFIYRIYENEDTIEVIEIQDPLSCEKEALSPQYEINQFRSVKSIRWEIKEIDDESGVNNEKQSSATSE